MRQLATFMLFAAAMEGSEIVGQRQANRGNLLFLNLAVQEDRGRSDSGELPKLKRPLGPYGVGRVGYHWTDSKRPDRFAADSKVHRELMVYLWYPAPRHPGDIKGSYFPGAKEIDAVPALQRRMREEFGIHWPSIVSGAITSHALESAPAAKNPRRFPIVIFSHGNGSSSFSYASLIEDLVSHGYVVAAVEHTQTSLAVRFPEGRIVPFRNEKIPAELSRAGRMQWMMKSASAGIEEGAADIRFVMKQLEERNVSGSQRFLLAGRLDLNRVAAMGHSAGGAFAARACQLDVNLKACVDLDGTMFPVAALPLLDGAVMKQPLLLLEAQHKESEMFGTKEELQEYFRKKEQQLQSCAPGSYDVILKSPGIAHPSFSDIPLFFTGTQGYPEISAVRHNHRLIQSFIRAFLDKNLRGRKAPLLDDSSRSHSEAIVQRYGQ
jgi:dienelactone hydrolase